MSSQNTEFKDTLSHTQLGANADKLGGWDNAMIAANAIELGNYQQVREIAEKFPQSKEIIERIITVSSVSR